MASRRKILFLGSLFAVLNAEGGDACGRSPGGPPVTSRPSKAGSTIAPPQATIIITESSTPYSRTMEMTTLTDDSSTTAGLDGLENQLRMVDNILSQGNVTTGDVQFAAEIVANVSNEVEAIERDPSSLELILTSLESVVDMEDASVEVTEPVVRTINNVMEFRENTLYSGLSERGRFVSALERQISAFQTRAGNFSNVLPNVGIYAVKVNSTIVNGNVTFANIGYVEGQDGVEGDLQSDNINVFNGGDLGDDGNRSQTSVSVPIEALGSHAQASQTGMEIPISFSLYRNAKLFVPSMPLQGIEDNLDNHSAELVTELIVSQVVSVRSENSNNTNSHLLPQSTVVAKFITNPTEGTEDEEEARSCVTWNRDRNGNGFWSKDGCDTTMDERDMRLTICSCNRLASFAVLVRVRKGNYEPLVPLSFITLIGSIISATCLIFCIVTFISMKQFRSKQPTYIHINLCLSLLGFYIAYLLGAPAVHKKVTCALSSAAIHFFCLSTVFWMSVEAINMYMTFIRTKPRGIRFFIPLACLFAYGCPAVSTILVSFLDKNSDYNVAPYCFIQPGKALYFGFLIVVAILFLLNFIIFVSVLRKVVFRPLLVSRTIENAKRNEIITRVRHGISFWFVLGLSWIFGFLSLAESQTKVFPYLFCICTSLQGTVMFLMLCVGNPDFRKVFSKFPHSRQTATTMNLTDLSNSHGRKQYIKA